ncbi:MAG: hypothetical protein ACR2L2_02990 [Acidobacteriota bacterium]
MATIRPYRESKSLAGKLRQLRRAGVLIGRRSTKRLPRWTPIKVKGVALSKLVRLEREAD